MEKKDLEAVPTPQGAPNGGGKVARSEGKPREGGQPAQAGALAITPAAVASSAPPARPDRKGKAKQVGQRLHEIAEMRQDPAVIRRLFESGEYPYQSKVRAATYEERMVELQRELLKCQRSVEETGQKIVVFVALMLMSKKSEFPNVERPDRLSSALGIHGVFIDGASGQSINWQVHRTPVGLVLFLAIGVVAGMFGIGAGWANVPALNLLMSVPLKCRPAHPGWFFLWSIRPPPGSISTAAPSCRWSPCPAWSG